MKRALLWISIAAGAMAIATWAATTMPSDNSTPATLPTAAAPATQPTALAQATQPTTQTTASANPTTNPSQTAVAQNDQSDQGSNNDNYNQNGRRNRRGLRNGNGNGNGNFGDQSDMSDIPPTSPMLAIYDTVSGRNLFIKGRQDQNYQAQADNGGFGNFNRGPQPLVFDGASLTDGTMIAYIEDTGTGTVNEAKVGDSDPRFGKIIQITLDELDLKQGDKTVTIAAGQTLSGESAFDTLYLSPTVTPSVTAAALPTTLPTGDDIISMMRRRRLQEMQQLNGGGPPGGGAGGTTTPPPAAR